MPRLVCCQAAGGAVLEHAPLPSTACPSAAGHRALPLHLCCCVPHTLPRFTCAILCIPPPSPAGSTESWSCGPTRPPPRTTRWATLSWWSRSTLPTSTHASQTAVSGPGFNAVLVQAARRRRVMGTKQARPGAACWRAVHDARPSSGRPTHSSCFALCGLCNAAGKMSQHLESLAIGDTIEVKGPLGHVHYTGRGRCGVYTDAAACASQLRRTGWPSLGAADHPMQRTSLSACVCLAHPLLLPRLAPSRSYTLNGEPRSVRRISMIAGGTGITPCYQVGRSCSSCIDNATTPVPPPTPAACPHPSAAHPPFWHSGGPGLA